MRLTLGAGALTIAALVACGTLTSNAGDGPIGDDAGVDGSTVDATVSEGGAVGEVGIAPCDATEVPPAGALYVSTSGQAAASGAADNPFLSITSALAIARAGGASTTIIVAEGTYNESLVLDSFSADITIDGSWVATGASWKRDCAPDRATTTLVRSTDIVGVRIKALGPKRAQLSNLSIRTAGSSATPDNTAGASRFGVFATDSVVALVNVSVVAANAGGGGVPIAGKNGGQLCTTALAECLAIAGPPGGDRGAAPSATSIGMIDATGYAPADGFPGTLSGDDGNYGTKGLFGIAGNSCFSGQNAACDSASTTTKPANQGRCGCGGTGGKPGGAGRGGGASIALVIAGGSAIVKYSELVGGEGGAGSAGGGGGVGGLGASGAQGASVDCWEPKICHTGTCPAACGCYHEANWPLANCPAPAPVNNVIVGGGAGGPGTNGGRGESGGGGAGGPSYAYVATANAEVAVTESKRSFGAGGAGGPGAANAPSGEHP